MGLMRRTVFEGLVGPVVIVLDEVAGDGRACVVEAAVFVEPDFLFFETAVEAFDQAVAFGMVVRGTAVGDAELAQGLKEAGGGELGAVVGGGGERGGAAACNQTFEDRAFECGDGFLGA